MNSQMRKELEILMGLSSDKGKQPKSGIDELGFENNEVNQVENRLKSTSPGIF